MRAQQALTQARYEELMETYRTATLSAFRDVENALSGATLYRQQLAAAREARAQSREAYRLADLRFRAGTVDFLTVLDAQRSIISTDDAVIQAQLSQLAALVDLYKALGGGWDGKLPPYRPSSRPPEGEGAVRSGGRGMSKTNAGVRLRHPPSVALRSATFPLRG